MMFGLNDFDKKAYTAPNGKSKLDRTLNDICKVVERLTLYIIVYGSAVVIIEQVIIAITNYLLKSKGLM